MIDFFWSMHCIVCVFMIMYSVVHLMTYGNPYATLSAIFLRVFIFLKVMFLLSTNIRLHIFLYQFNWTYGLLGSSSYSSQIKEAPLSWIAFVSLRSFPKSGNYKF